MRADQHIALRLFVRWTLALCVAVGLVLVAAGARAETARATATTAATGTTTQANDTQAGSSASASAKVQEQQAKAQAAATAQAQAQATRLATIKNRGDAEINRRLTQLNRLTNLIAAATHLTASNKTTLTNQVSGEISGLQSLETRLNAETTLTAAIADAKSIIAEYRVYALITPKIHLITVADDQQANEANLTALAAKLQARLTSAQQAGKSVTTLQTQLTDLTDKVTSAQAISSTVEAAVIGLQPSDYDSNHEVLNGEVGQLKTAHADNQAAYQDAKNIVAGLESLH